MPSERQTFIKFDDHAPDHPKVAGLSDRAFRTLMTSLVRDASGRSPVADRRMTRPLIAAGLLDNSGTPTADARAFVFGTGHWGGSARPPIPQDVRDRVMARDGCCQQCGALDELQIDHIYPWSRGGTHDEVNLQVLCGTCNRRKGARV